MKHAEREGGRERARRETRSGDGAREKIIRSRETDGAQTLYVFLLPLFIFFIFVSVRVKRGVLKIK